MKNFRRWLVAACWVLLIYLCASSSVSAQAVAPEKKWSFLTEIYLLMPNIDGETGVGNSLTVPVDANTGDILSKLKMGAMVYVEARHNKWTITSDYVFMNLQEKITPGKLIQSGTITLKQSIWEAAGFYRLNSFLEVGAGGRLNYLVTNFDGTRNVLPIGTEEMTGHHSVTFYDPILIARVNTVIKDKWLVKFHGDLGGFGVGSDFTWQLQAYAGYRFTKLFQLTGGYRILSTDYNKGSGVKQFIFNVNEYGPVIRFGFNF
ncbi:MAG: hypothetical protein ABL895_11270 [Cyclobacteriaceae bacterium]